MDDNTSLPQILQAYDDHPMRDGDCVLLMVDEKLATEIAGLADAWDPVVRRNLVQILRELRVAEVQLGIARFDRRLLPHDHRIAAELEEDLRSSGTRVHPLIPLPAAA